MLESLGKQPPKNLDDSSDDFTRQLPSGIEISRDDGWLIRVFSNKHFDLNLSWQQDVVILVQYANSDTVCL